MEFQTELDKISHRQEEAMLGVGRIIRAGVKMKHLGKVFREFRTSGKYLERGGRVNHVQPLSYLASSLGSLI